MESRWEAAAVHVEPSVMLCDGPEGCDGGGFEGLGGRKGGRGLCQIMADCIAVWQKTAQQCKNQKQKMKKLN